MQVELSFDCPINHDDEKEHSWKQEVVNGIIPQIHSCAYKMKETASMTKVEFAWVAIKLSFIIRSDNRSTSLHRPNNKEKK